MKRFFSILFLILTILSILAALAWGGYCVWDHQQMLNTPGLSGIDFLMSDAFYGVGFVLICIVGAICALIQCRLTDRGALQIFDYIVVGVFFLVSAAAFLMIM